MMNEHTGKVLTEIYKNVNLYRDASLCLPPEKSMPILIMLFSLFQELYPFLTKRQQGKLEPIFGRLMKAQEDQDFVLIRDILIFDLNKFFMSIKSTSSYKN